MRIDEFMIGNIVKCVWDDEIYEVIILDFRGMVYIKNIAKEDNIEGHECLLKSIYPLPITIEWLVKNGFEERYEDICDYYYYTKEINNGLYRIEIKFGVSNTSISHVVCHIDNSDCQTFCSADIQYIHQLQNLLNILDIKEKFIV